MEDPYALAVEAAAAVAEATGVDAHDAVVVLGSGWSGAVAGLGEPVATLDVATLPGFHAPVAAGHEGVVRSLRLPRSAGADVRVLAFCGRTHLYEGHGADAVAHPVRTAAAAGCRTAVLTNANGSLRPQWGPGTGVVLGDHLNLSGDSPLTGPRFVDLGTVYDATLRAAARAADPDLVEGVYAMLRGPHYETVAEALALRAVGADVVGMSTVLEAVAAREAGLAVLGLSVVTAVEAQPAAVDPDEVVRVAAAAATRFGAVIAHVLATSPPASTGPPVTHTPAASPAPHPARHPGSDPSPGGAP